MRIVISLFALSCTTMSLAAGFDCRKASTATEKLICKTEHLSELDSRLNRVFRMSIWHKNKQVILKAKEEQRNWLITVRDRCTDKMCLQHAYLTRLNKIISVKTSLSEGEYVGGTAEFSGQEADFRNSLNHNGIAVSACPFMVRYIDRSYTAGRDSSYGAFCLSKDDTIIMVCDDTMVGNLTFKSSGFDISHSTLLDFTKNNCPPGG